MCAHIGVRTEGARGEGRLAHAETIAVATAGDEGWSGCHGCEPLANRVQIALKWTRQHEWGEKQ